MRQLVLPSLAALSLGSLMTVGCSSDTTPGTATPTSATTTATTGTTGTGGHGGQSSGGSSQTGGAGHGGNTAAGGQHAGGGGNGGAGGGGGSAGGGGSDPDAGTDCTVPAFCPGTDEPCRIRTCIGGKCGMTNSGAGTPAGAPQPGTCQSPICDGKGGTTTIEDDSNLPVDGKPCTDDVCASGIPSNPPAAKGTICNSLGTPKYCDGAGACIECKVDAECNGGTCKASECAGASPCNDGLQNGLETDKDCGGGVCPACDAQHACKVNGDCLSNLCTNKVCLPPPPTCNDGKKNQDETDVDCGGATCGKCDALKQCSAAGDCKSDLCLGGVTKHCIDKATVNGCDITKAENHIGENEVPVSFGGGVGNKYQPACIIITPSTPLKFNGDFSIHPLQGGTVKNGVGTPDPQSMFPLTPFGMTKTFMPSLMPGNFGFYCTTHVGAGMMGAAFVVP